MAVAEARRNRKTPPGEPLRVVLVPTPKFEEGTYKDAIGWAKDFFNDAYTTLQVLHLFQEESPDLEAATAMIEGADMLFVTGGSTEIAIAYWERTGLDAPLRAAFLAGTVTFGISAGLIPWGTMCNTDSDAYGKPKGTSWKYKMIRALDVFGSNIWICPHAADIAREYTFNETDYGPDTTRRHVFVDQLANGLAVARRENVGIDDVPMGIAVDGDTAIHIKGDTVSVIGAGSVTLHRLGEIQEFHEGESFLLTALVPQRRGRRSMSPAE